MAKKKYDDPGDNGVEKCNSNSCCRTLHWHLQVGYQGLEQRETWERGQYGEKLGKKRLVIWWGSRGAHWAFSKHCPFCGENIEAGWPIEEPAEAPIDESEVIE